MIQKFEVENLKSSKKTGALCLIFICLFMIYSVIVAGVTGAVTVGENANLPEMLIPGGNVIGVKLYTKGVHIVGITFVETEDGKVYPARQAGLREGDFITNINGNEVNDNESFARYLQAGGEISLTAERNGASFETTLTPVASKDDGLLRAGLWVRDSTAGIGTVTFYNPESETFGALGHGIADQDTGKILTVNKGYIYNAYLTSVRKGAKGSPGELNGIFANQERQIGELNSNTERGVYGSYNSDAIHQLKEPMPVGGRDSVKEGPATIYASIDKDEVKEYQIEIVKVVKNNAFSSKGMVIKITDPELIEKTNGIVQGMSGSPIIQDGKLIGAVTHVFVNDPTRGYAIFIENMLAEAQNISN